MPQHRLAALEYQKVSKGASQSGIGEGSALG